MRMYVYKAHTGIYLVIIQHPQNCTVALYYIMAVKIVYSMHYSMSCSLLCLLQFSIWPNICILQHWTANI